MKKLNLLGLLVAGACTFQACQNSENRGTNDSAQMDSSTLDTSAMSSPAGSTDSMSSQSKVNSDETAFMKKAAIGGMMEVDLGQVALKSSNAKVKDFAQLMIKDHTKANGELKMLAANSGVTLPTTYPADEQSHVDAMKKMTGADFDKHYIGMMVTDHDKTIALFKSAANSENKGLHDFVNNTLPVITGHDEKAKAIQTSLK